MQATLVGLTEHVSMAMVKRAAAATSMKALEPVFSEVLAPNGKAASPAYSLILLELALNLSASTPVAQIIRTANDLKGNRYALQILKHLALAHLNVNYVDRGIAQKICSALDIKLPKDVLTAQ